MYVPPLVTTSPDRTDVSDAGVLGADGTSILFGSTSILDGSRSGGRIRVGSWIGDGDCVGIEGEYFGLDKESVWYRAESDVEGLPILARPFFNINPRVGGTGDFDPPAREDSELVAYPGILAGSVSVHATTQLESAGVRLRWNFCCNDLSCSDPCGCCGIVHRSRLDLLLGYRYLELNESLAIREDLTSRDPNEPGQFDILDQFGTQNQFHGVEIGALWELEHQRWFVEMLAKLALGNNHQVVRINGITTAIPVDGPAGDGLGGLLALQSNIGRYERDDFAVVPELGVTVGYRLTERLRATVGYTFVYWSRVQRPGEAIDLDVNPDLLPGDDEQSFAGALRPRFAFDETDFWAQGFGFGLDYRW